MNTSQDEKMNTSQPKIPCSVEILTRNSEATLERCLQSLKDFAEIIVLDGNSIDRTLQIASRFGCRIVKQYESDEPEIKIGNFSEVRNKGLRRARYDWFMYVDSDEYLSPELADEIRVIVADPSPEARVWWQPRKYVYEGKVIDCAVTYPNRQIRFFHKSAVKEFIKSVHERIEVRPGEKIGALKHFEYVPLDSFAALRSRWVRYLLLEQEILREHPLTARRFLRFFWRQIKIVGLYAYRYLRILFFCRGTRLPARYEFGRIEYHLRLAGIVARAFLWR